MNSGMTWMKASQAHPKNAVFCPFIQAGRFLSLWVKKLKIK
jgi:hypothetical protein